MGVVTNKLEYEDNKLTAIVNNDTFDNQLTSIDCLTIGQQTTASPRIIFLEKHVPSYAPSQESVHVRLVN